MKFLYILLFLQLFAISVISQPTIVDEEVSINNIASAPSGSIRLSFNKNDSTLYLITQEGNIYRVRISRGLNVLVQTNNDHGLSDVQGFDISEDGRFFIVGNNKNSENATNVATIMRANVIDNEWIWEKVAETEPYPTSNTAFDHIMNGIVVSPDGSKLYINSGSRTDHGEIHDVDGRYPGLREAPLTAKILTIPSDTTNLLLENNLESLREKGFIYAEGTRNSFSLAFDGEGNLFGTENAGDRDDSEELNWLQKGKHYGFPWVIGGNETPMQFPGYDPDSDPFIPSNSTAANLGTFYEDLDYPEPPDGVEFTSAVTNIGPDADNFRDREDGLLKDASELGISITTFTSHLSPLGLVFDTEGRLGSKFTGNGFMLGFSGGAPGDPFLLPRMGYHGEDLLHLTFTKTDDNYEISTRSIVKNLINPIDAEIIGNKIYLIEHRNDQWLNVGADTRIWEVSFPALGTNIENEENTASKFHLHQNYPNPFNPSTTIAFDLSKPGFVELEIHNVLGKKIATLISREMIAKTNHTVSFEASNLNSGIYFYTLTVDGFFINTQKMTLIK
ncbi:MAG: PQQ-dependent sugar dehydrogenase [Balneolaceae bacterium]